MSAAPLNHDRLVAIINMIASDNDNEMLVAARKLRTMAKERGQLVVEFLRANLAPAARQQSNGFGDRYREDERKRQREAESQRQREEDVWASYRADRERADARRAAEQAARQRREEAAQQAARQAREKKAADKRQAEEAARARAEQARKPAGDPWDDELDDVLEPEWPHPGLNKDERRRVEAILAKCRLGTWAKGFLESVLAQKYNLTPRQQAKLDEVIDEHNASGW